MADSDLEKIARQVISKIKDGGKFKKAPKGLSEALSFLEKKKYIKIVGGTPKSGPRYIVTDKGEEFYRNTNSL